MADAGEQHEPDTQRDPRFVAADAPAVHHAPAGGNHAESAEPGADHATTDHATTDHATTDHATTDHATTDHATTDHARQEHAHEDHEHNPFDAAHLIGHVKDADYFEVPKLFAPDGHLKIPQLRDTSRPIWKVSVGYPPVDNFFEPLDFKITKFMVLEVVAALLIAAVFIPLARRIRSGAAPRGRAWNFFEAMLVFIRDQVARPAIGEHEADKFLPYLWTAFFFVLTCNLLGLLPWAGSPTGALAATGAMAFTTFMVVVIGGSLQLGVMGFWANQVPHMDLPWYIGVFLKPMIFGIEVMGLGIKHFVLAMRLFANMMAGHLVLAVLLIFIVAAWKSAAVYGVIPASLLGATALSLLELFVAFLQAYIFTFLSALFIGMAVHSH